MNRKDNTRREVRGLFCCVLWSFLEWDFLCTAWIQKLKGGKLVEEGILRAN